jgi:guanylate kinase
VLPPEELAKTKAVILAQIKEKLHNKAKRLNKIEEFDLIIENTDIMDELARIDKKITGLK